MNNQVNSFVSHVREAAISPDFIHNKWYIKYHLEIVEKIALELCDLYKEADAELVRLLVWLHDYGKFLDNKNQYQKTVSAGTEKLQELGFTNEITEKAISSVVIIDRKNPEELKNSSIEIKIVSSADAASHFTGPFFSIWWQENHNKDFEQLMKDNLNKIAIDWEQKMVLPEARKYFEKRKDFLLELNGKIPATFINK